ncbi:LysR family transcriptional regulator [Paraburkholderia dipogonis]|uniref:LysR family transcriptional regulator n=1 Tax=Paraburkholderia dipogonis TaxID=1211383 RepID=A0A4Y8MWI2_9BURK|nr:LysR family transcriptional regulator [Paraburkholderia dipogonis]TFE41910.1 LysR family transcriptional regulator [Paraburkholderia dipogonis]
MELRQIRHFIAVAETGSFTKASERVSISQPALSASIAKLEAEFDVKLLDRGRARVVPTAAGVRLIEKANAILLVCNSVKSEVRSVAKSQAMRIGVLRTLSARAISNLITSFRRDNPGLAVALFDGTSAELLKQLTERRLDAIITIVEEDTAEEFESRILFKESFMLAVPSDHRFAKEQSVKLNELQGEPFISRTGCEMFKETIKVFVDRGVKLRVTFKTDQEDRALCLVNAGVGLAIVPELFTMPGTVLVRISDFDIHRSVCLQWLPDNDDEQLREFVKVVSGHAWRAPTVQ